MSKWSAKPDTEATWKKSAATEASGQYVHKLYLYLYIEKIKFNKKKRVLFYCHGALPAQDFVHIRPPFFENFNLWYKTFRNDFESKSMFFFPTQQIKLRDLLFLFQPNLA
jgi:hypothetical protein